MFKRPRRGWLTPWLLVLLLLVGYGGTYLSWTRCLACRPSDGLWSFFPPPSGLGDFDVWAGYRRWGRTKDEGWQRQESIPGFVFRPCIWIDDRLSGRRYLPTYQGVVSFN